MKALKLLAGLGMMLMITMLFNPSLSFANGEFIDGSYGGKSYKLYIPSNYDSNTPSPLYVLLHGCTQDAEQFATGTQMNSLAEKEGFLVLYPEQSSSANLNKCWNWFDPDHQNRGSGEPAVIAGMVQSVENNYTINKDQVYAAGLSAGAAMSVIMGATYPDIFSGVGVGAGLEYKAAESTVDAYSAMSSGGPDPAQQGKLAYQAMDDHAKKIPVMVIHGTSDYTVNRINAEQVIKQWAVTNDLAENATKDGWIDDTPESTESLQVPSGRSYTISNYKGEDGKVWMKKVLVQGMGHAWSGGSNQGSYTDPQGPDANRLMVEFFQSFSETEDPDPSAPVTTATVKGGTYNSPITVELKTNEPATTYYTRDGSKPTTQSEVYSQPLQITDDTILKYFSQDAEGNKESVKQETYTINESEPGTSEVILSSAAEDGYVGKYAADGLGEEHIKVGDKGMYNTDTYRGVLSFHTDRLPENTIQSAKVRLYVKDKEGLVPSIRVDINRGVLGSSAAIEQSDYRATPSKNNSVTFSTQTLKNYIEFQIPPEDLTFINKNGITQLRLRAITESEFNQDWIEFYGGEHTTSAPQLIVTTNH
ncbi:extracellular catalytic domain type 1 short-chain-length polyhydroxyalkanoate depolymerase [Halobacillus hunanensis]|uniref:extracellular catalytic domain type 1 short-chain-length polyhydroxyalkanoate depolymerase n=1 Tax=Halobacillus hunanensis TaxID=578214 RepID=UPI001116CE06|nr:PHB depolymerase family esterase [Halobacillus hunanensis]